jgi:hypothetical protein
VSITDSNVQRAGWAACNDQTLDADRDSHLNSKVLGVGCVTLVFDLEATWLTCVARTCPSLPACANTNNLSQYISLRP